MIRTITSKKNIILTIFLAGFLLISFNLTSTAQAAGKLIQKEQSISGSTFREYNTTCEHAKSTSKTTAKSKKLYIKKKRGIVIPDGVSGSVNTIYIYFHGLTQHSNIQSCKDHKICENAKVLKDNGVNAVYILAPNVNDGNIAAKPGFKESEFNCLLTEAKEVLKNELGINADSSSVNLVSHSGGSEFILGYMKSKTVNKAILLDSCYGNSCKKIANQSSIYQAFFYGQEKGSKKEGINAKKGYDTNPKKSKLTLTPNSHYDVLKKCFADHVLDDKCGGWAKSVTQPTDKPQEAPKSSGGAGLCHCINGEAPPKLETCYEVKSDTECKTKETGTTNLACYLASGQSGKCDEPKNTSFLTTNGDCTCTIPGKTTKTSTNHDPTQCAVLQVNAKKANPTVKDEVKCTWALKAAGTAGKPKTPGPAPITAPTLHVPLPGLNFTKSITQEQHGDPITIPWLAEYATAAYQYFTGVGIIVAIIIIMIGGIQWMTAANSGRLGKAQEKIRNATMGLMLLVGSYLILFTINPNILSFKALELLTAVPDPIHFDDEDEGVYPASDYQPSSTASAVSAKKAFSGFNPVLTGAPCSSERAISLASQFNARGGKKDGNNRICMGPCHCAWSATRFMNYIGCGNTLSSWAAGGTVAMIPKGWSTIYLKDPGLDYKNLPIGFIYKLSGHIEVSLGKGKIWGSGGGAANVSKWFPGCSGYAYDTAITDAENQKAFNACGKCGLIKGHEPWSKAYAGTKVKDAANKKLDRCSGNQVWQMRDHKALQKFDFLVYPSSKNSEPIGCCEITKVWRAITPEKLCTILTKYKIKKLKPKGVHVKGRWTEGVVDESVCGVNKTSSGKFLTLPGT